MNSTSIWKQAGRALIKRAPGPYHFPTCGAGDMIDAQVHLELQQRVLEFVQQHNLQTDVAYRSLALRSEVGELSKEVLKATDYDTKPFLPNTDWADELGDIFFTIIILANSTGIALDTALERVLAKYNERLMTKGTPGSGR